MTPYEGCVHIGGRDRVPERNTKRVCVYIPPFVDSIVLTQVIHPEDAIASSSYKIIKTGDAKQGLLFF